MTQNPNYCGGCFVRKSGWTAHPVRSGPNSRVRPRNQSTLYSSTAVKNTSCTRPSRLDPYGKPTTSRGFRYGMATTPSMVEKVQPHSTPKSPRQLGVGSSIRSNRSSRWSLSQKVGFWASIRPRFMSFPAPMIAARCSCQAQTLPKPTSPTHQCRRSVKLYDPTNYPLTSNLSSRWRKGRWQQCVKATSQYWSS
jgi:hypothetical protein